MDQLLANPALAAATIQGADGQEAAEVALRIYQRLMDADLETYQLKYLVAFYTGRFVTLLSAEDARVFASEVTSQSPESLLPTVLAALSTGGAGIPGYGDMLRELADEAGVGPESINNPRIPLTPPVYNLLTSALGTTQTLPPVVTDSLPPPIIEGQPTPAATPTATPVPTPIIPEPYDGQR